MRAGAAGGAGALARAMVGAGRGLGEGAGERPDASARAIQGQSPGRRASALGEASHRRPAGARGASRPSLHELHLQVEELLLQGLHGFTDGILVLHAERGQVCGRLHLAPQLVRSPRLRLELRRGGRGPRFLEALLLADRLGAQLLCLECLGGQLALDLLELAGRALALHASLRGQVDARRAPRLGLGQLLFPDLLCLGECTRGVLGTADFRP
mmetsp:Transcript_73188/g.214719  ORF Transcript_73188/g.214719 Transcript_73188/m.214719 type:complete len:213 (-) Transcript_73188:1083-1721(-)